jgi:hypothetical protein
MWRKLHKRIFMMCTLHKVHIIRTIKSRRMRWAGHVSRMREKRNTCTLLVGKPEGKRPLGRSKRRWVDDVMDLSELEWGVVDWIGLTQNRNS